VFKQPLTQIATVAGAAVLAGTIGASRHVLAVHWHSGQHSTSLRTA
jgi:hypothetical protein